MKLYTLLGWRLAGFLLVCCALELYLWSFTTYGQLVVTERSERFGWQMLPSQSRWSREGDVEERINSDGYRDREWDAPREAGDGFEKDASLLRVAVLGNSMTYGTSVPIEDTWPRVLEEHLARDLAQRGDARTALVMNFAVQGYALEQMQRVYEDRVRPYRPDVLIVPLHVGDILPVPQFVGEPKLRYRRPWFRTATRDLLYREAWGRWIPAAALPPEAAVPEVDYKPLLRDDPQSPKLFRLWSQAGARLNALQEDVEARGGRLAIVILPTLEHLLAPKSVDPSFQLEPWAEQRNAARPGSPPVVVISARTEFAQAQEILSRAILARFPAGVEGLPQDKKKMRYLPEDLTGFDERLFLEQDVGHYSARGHRLLGGVVFERGAAAGLWR